jgi:hypothetical protein
MPRYRAAPRVRYPGPALWRPACRDADLRDGGRKLVQLAVEITAPPEDTGAGRRALRGKILRAGPGFDQYVSQDAPVTEPRDPVTYFESPWTTGRGAARAGAVSWSRCNGTSSRS